MYDLPDLPPRPFVADYPSGGIANEAGGLARDIDGRPLVARYVVGRSTPGGADTALPPSALDEITKAGTGEPAAFVAPSALGRGTVGAVLVNKWSRRPEQLLLSNDLTGAELAKVFPHEVGHVIDQISGEIPTDGLMREVASLFDYLNNSNPSRNSFVLAKDGRR